MCERCCNKKNTGYKKYGEKGIQIYKEWLDKPELFEQWALEHGYNHSLSIDRIDPKQDYCPNNCRWITLQMNDKWKSTSHHIIVDDIEDTGRGWAKRLGFSNDYINKKYKKYGKEYVINLISELLNNSKEKLAS